MRALVSDATGTLGRFLCDGLVAAGWDIVGLSDEKDAAPAGVDLRAWPKRADGFAKAVVGCDAVIVPDLMQTGDLPDTAEKRLRALVKAGGAARFILLSPMAVYDAGALADGMVPEEGAIAANPAPAAKLALAIEAAMANLAEAVALRCAPVYGHAAPLEEIRFILKEGVAPQGFEGLYGLSCDSLLAALLRAAAAPGIGGQVLNLGDPFALPGEDFTQEIARLGRLLSDQPYPSDVERPEYALASPDLDTARLSAALGPLKARAVWSGLARMTQAAVKAYRAEGSGVPAIGGAASPAMALERGETPMRGMTVVLTGATSLVGQASALMMVRLGADLVAVTKDAEKGEALLAEIAKLAPDASVKIITADLSELAELRRAAAEISQICPKIDALINNGGSIFGKRRVNADEIEVTWSQNVLAPYLLSSLLSDALLGASAARVVNVTSEAHRGVQMDFSDLQNLDFQSFKAYCTSQMAVVLLTYGMAAHFGGGPVSAHAIALGREAVDSDLSDVDLSEELHAHFVSDTVTVDRAARYLVNVAMSPDFAGANGLYVNMTDPADSAPQSYKRADIDMIWSVAERMTS